MVAIIQIFKFIVSKNVTQQQKAPLTFLIRKTHYYYYVQLSSWNIN